MPSKQTYAATAKRIIPIKDYAPALEEQGIIFSYVKGAPFRPYLLGINSILKDPLSIKGTHKVGNGRVIVFLNSKAHVDTIIEQTGSYVNDKFITADRLKPTSFKLVFSNISPMCPNIVLEKYLREKLNLNLKSNTSILREDPHDDPFSHVVCSRRQVYIQDKPEDSFLFRAR